MKSQFLQHYYTASIQTNGFGVLDHAKDLEFEELEELQERGEYTVASGLSVDTHSGIDLNKHPENKAFFRLEKSNRYVFLNSVYTGYLNHTPDRPGNFFSHSYVLVNPELELPAKRYLSALNFRKSLSVEEDENYVSTLQNPIELEIKFSREEEVGLFQEVCEFFKCHPKGVQILSLVVDIIVAEQIFSRGKNLSICDEKNNLTPLITGLHFLIPPSLSKNVSFATYVNNPNSYSFNITGVIPECNLDSLNNEYVTLVNRFNISEDYLPKEQFTQLLVNAISESNYENWKSLCEDIESFPVEQLGPELNQVGEFSGLISNMGTVSLEKFLNMYKEVNKDKQEQMLKEAILKNHALAYDFLSSELDRYMNTTIQFENQWSEFMKIYESRFVPNIDFHEACFPQFAVSFHESVFSGNKGKSALKILMECDCASKSMKGLRDDLLLASEDYLDESFLPLEEKCSIVGDLSKIIDDSELSDENIPTIMRLKSVSELKEEAAKGQLIRSFNKYKKHLLGFKESEQIKILSLALAGEFKKPFSGNFGKYLSISKEIFGDSHGIFWEYFFRQSNNDYNPENSLDVHSLSYLKKLFIAKNYVDEHYDSELIKSIPLKDQNEFDWIEEYIREHSIRLGTPLSTFYDEYTNTPFIRRNDWVRLAKKSIEETTRKLFGTRQRND